MDSKGLGLQSPAKQGARKGRQRRQERDRFRVGHKNHVFHVASICGKHRCLLAFSCYILFDDVTVCRVTHKACPAPLISLSLPPAVITGLERYEQTAMVTINASLHARRVPWTRLLEGLGC